jgi:uncharacterized protein YjbI with pentapeptide repeats
MSRLVAVAAVCGLVGAITSLPTAAAATMPRLAEGIRIELLAGRSVLLPDRTKIVHDLVLSGQTVRGSLVCKRCTFSGAIRAPHARFEREIDLSGSTVHGVVDLESATFLGPVRFGRFSRARERDSRLGLGCDRSERAGALFMKRVDLAFSTFNDDADFEEATFCEQASFASARFRAAVRFGHADFRSTSLFPAADFDHEAFFASAEFGGDLTDFGAATFGGVADFRQAVLGGPIPPRRDFPITFADAVFRERADFSQVKFLQRASFQDSRMADGVFRAATFKPSENVPNGMILVSFDHATVGGRLDLDEATLLSAAELRSLSTAKLSLRETRFGDSFTLHAHAVSVGELVASLDSLDHVDNDRDRIALLRLLESSAKARSDLRLANDAHFRLQALEARDDWLPRRVADYTLYRHVAGYLVRPSYPLLWLILIVFFATMVRTGRLLLNARRGRASEPDAEVETPGEPSAAREEQTGASAAREEQTRPAAAREEQTGPSAKPSSPHPVKSSPGEGVGQSVLTAFWLTVTGRPEPSPLRRAELMVYVLLVACILVALANTNPTLRDMIDTVR